jgi:hypothetical protein
VRGGDRALVAALGRNSDAASRGRGGDSQTPPRCSTPSDDSIVVFIPSPLREIHVTYQTTVGWSLITSGIVTLLLAYLPYPSVYWGVGLLLVGILVFVARRVI